MSTWRTFDGSSTAMATSRCCARYAARGTCFSSPPRAERRATDRVGHLGEKRGARPLRPGPSRSPRDNVLATWIDVRLDAVRVAVGRITFQTAENIVAAEVLDAAPHAPGLQVHMGHERPIDQGGDLVERGPTVW